MKAEHIKALTGIRIVAAMWVVLFHFRETLDSLQLTFGFLEPLIEAGHQAVPLFFILSGFILCHNYYNRYELRQHARFVWSRFARLWPVHLVALVAMVVYRTAYYWWGSVGVERPNYGNLPFELIMVRTWGTRELDWNFPAWSIQAEWFAYIFVFPMTLLGMRMIENRWLIFVIPTLLLFLHGQLDFQAFPNLLGEIVLLFVGGCFLYRVRSELRRGPWVSWVATASVVFGILALLLSSKWSPSLLYLSFGVLILALSYDAGLLARLLGCRIMLYGGAISYSLYMTHWLVKIAFSFLVGKLDLGSYGESVVAAGGYVVSTLICAALFYHIVEKPAHRLLLKRGNVSS